MCVIHQPCQKHDDHGLRRIQWRALAGQLHAIVELNVIVAFSASMLV
jgi:hypothetical protein